jgi:hypothetical protein
VGVPKTVLKGAAMNLASVSSSLPGSPAATSVSRLTISLSATLEVTSAAPATSVELSGPAKFLAALEKLQREKPEDFKQVVAELAKQVRAAADASGGREHRFLERLARRLDRVAETGDLSALQRGRHGEGRRVHGVQAYQAALAQAPQGGAPAEAAPHGHHDHDGDDDATAAPPPPPPPPSAGLAPAGPPAAAGPKQTIAELLAELIKKVEEAVAAPAPEATSTPPAATPGSVAALFEAMLKKVQDALAPAAAPDAQTT